VPHLAGALLHLADILRVHRDADHDHAGVVLLERRDLGNLLDARHAPRGPEIHHDVASLVVREPVPAALGVGDVEGGCGKRRQHYEGRHENA